MRSRAGYVGDDSLTCLDVINFLDDAGGGGIYRYRGTQKPRYIYRYLGRRYPYLPTYLPTYLSAVGT